MAKKPHNLSIKQWPEGERPREKLIQFGAERLTDAELLAILLRIGNEGESAIDVGRDRASPQCVCGSRLRTQSS
jgi:DNA repair protein RadC